MCDSDGSVRGKGGGKWSTLRDAFLSAVAASKGEGEHAAQGGGNGASDRTESSRFEGFVLFPRCAVHRRRAFVPLLPSPK